MSASVTSARTPAAARSVTWRPAWCRWITPRSASAEPWSSTSLNRNRSNCASGSGYVPSNSTGFWVATTRNTAGSPMRRPSIVTWCSSMASSSADWVLAGARLTSSATTTLAKMGPRRNTNVAVAAWNTLVPRMSEGIRSGVNWMRWKRSVASPAEPSSSAARQRAISVLAVPGTPSTSTLPPTSSAASSKRNGSSRSTRTPRVRANAAAWNSAGVIEGSHRRDQLRLGPRGLDASQGRRAIGASLQPSVVATEGVAGGAQLTRATVQAGQHLDVLVHGAPSLRRRTGQQRRAEGAAAQRQGDEREQGRVDDRPPGWGVEQQLVEAGRTGRRGRERVVDLVEGERGAERRPHELAVHEARIRLLAQRRVGEWLWRG